MTNPRHRLAIYGRKLDRLDGVVDPDAANSAQWTRWGQTATASRETRLPVARASGGAQLISYFRLDIGSPPTREASAARTVASASNGRM